MAEPAVIPLNLFGDVPERFYADLGRVTMLAALLDQRLQDLYVQMFGVPQDDQAGAAGTRLIAKCQQRLAVFHPDQRERASTFLASALDALHQRNAVLHSLWVFQGAGGYGWRYPTDVARRGTVATQAVDQLPQLIQDLVGLNADAMSVAAFVRHGEVS